MTPVKSARSLGIVGARGHVGRELLNLLGLHDGFRLDWAASRSMSGTSVSTFSPGLHTRARFEALAPAEAAVRGADAVVLALPNGEAARWVAAFEERSPSTIIVDLSADYRFDWAWRYGLVERHRPSLQGARRIANPGCYATGMQLGLGPVVERWVGIPRAFGVSGYSGAGTTPSPRNDPTRLSDNLLPYSLTDHLHEREVTRHLGREVRFLPHVASFFRGISLTLSLDVDEPMDAAALEELYREVYAGERLVDVVSDVPEVRDNRERHVVRIGGFSTSPDGRGIALVVTLDNLLKGAATQALQNLNLAFQYDELRGITLT